MPASAVLDVVLARQASPAKGGAKRQPPGEGLAAGLLALSLAAGLATVQGTVLCLVPTTGLLAKAVCAAFLGFVLLVAVLRRLAAEPQLQVTPEVLEHLTLRDRVQGVEYWRSAPPVEGRIDGAVLLTGSTGFVGGGVLFSLLARAKELGITRVALLIRAKSGAGAEERLAELRNNPAFGEVRDAFDELVMALEGDVAQRDFGWSDASKPWPCREPLRAVLHCAGDVRFDQPLQQAALSVISASLQVTQLSARWGARRFVFVSTAFVHGVPSATNFLQESLVELRDFDPMELYRDAVAHGRWAEKAMRDLGFPNTYTFTKAVAEHLIIQAGQAERLDVRIVRPSIVGPAWAAPYAGWSGDKPSTILALAVLLARRGLRVFRSSKFPCPAVPVDVVAGAIVEALACPGGDVQITHAAVDASEADRVPSVRTFTDHFFRVLALRGDISLPEAGLLFKLMRWADNPTAFCLMNATLNLGPNLLAVIAATIGSYAAQMTGLGVKTWGGRCRSANRMLRYSLLGQQFAPFTSPSSAWLFHSSVRLPRDWDPVEYSLLIYRAAVCFAKEPTKAPPRGLGSDFCDLRVVVPRPLWEDALLAFSMPGQSTFVCGAAFLVRRVLQWMDLTVTVDAASLTSVTSLAVPLVLCPTHRSLLDFVIIGSACFQLRPLVPAMQMPSVAADAEFAGLPLLGRILAALGAFVRRGGGSVQPDPALRAEVGRVFRNSRPLEVFLEGLRSRGRRQLRLRTGLLRALRDVSQRTVALVPIALSYELLPEDESFYNELSGLPRAPLSTAALANWVLRGLRGDLPSYGDAHVKLGKARVLEASSDVRELLVGVQEEFVTLTLLTTLHARALAEVVGLPAEDVLGALRDAGLPIRKSRIDGMVQLTEAQRWPLAVQASTLFREKLPQSWAQWLVEPVVARDYTDGASADVSPASASGTWESGKGPLDMDMVMGALALQFWEAEAAALDAAERLRDGGMATVTEEHLLQQLLSIGDPSLPPAIARGAASIVAGYGRNGCAAGYDAPFAKPEKDVQILWPAAHPAAGDAQRSADEALDRWGFKDTRFVAQWVDG